MCDCHNEEAFQEFTDLVRLRNNIIMPSAITTVISMLSLYTSLISANNLLHCNYYQGHCICPEDIVVFVCSVSDGVATVWRGSIFNCPSSGNEILSRHFNFESGTSGTCNDGQIAAYSTEVTNSYSSQLNVTVSPEMHNGTVECIQEGFNETSVGVCTLILAMGKHYDNCAST